MKMSDLGQVAQALRMSHCAHRDAGRPDHACVGVCTIRRDGVVLDCAACGHGDEMIAPAEFEAADCRAVFEAAGIRWASLSPEAQAAAVAELDRRSR